MNSSHFPLPTFSALVIYIRFLLPEAIPLLSSADRGRLWLSSWACEGAMEKRGGTVRHVVGRRRGQ